MRVAAFIDEPAPLGIAAEDVVAIAARAHERDRYLAALLAPREIRADLIALAAFAGEVGRIPAFVSEPMMGRIRLQWWRERIEEGTSGGHPVAAAIIDAMHRRALPAARLTNLIEAHEDSLDDRPFANDEALFSYLDRIDGALFELAAKITGASPGPALVMDGGRAYGLARLLSETPATLAHGRLLLPTKRLGPPSETGLDDHRAVMRDLSTLARQHLGAIARDMRQLSRHNRAAFLPLALVEPYLEALEQDQAKSRAAVEINPARRVWRLWRCHRTGTV